MVPVSRIGDLAVGVCNFGISHPIICSVVASSVLTFVDNLGIVCIGDLYTTTCQTHNPAAVSISSSVITTDLGLGVARVGDLAVHLFGTASLATGSPITNSD